MRKIIGQVNGCDLVIECAYPYDIAKVKVDKAVSFLNHILHMSGVFKMEKL